jgi:N-formylglutamate amidohydrolase
VEAWEIARGAGPVVACGIHCGHDVRPEVAALLAVDEKVRSYEEDPYSGGWAEFAPTRILVHRSRFEFDLNRPRDKAVYLEPDDAWGLQVWKEPPPRDVLEESLRLYDGFYAELETILEDVAARCGRFVLYDLHSYNHRPPGEAEVPRPEPDINLGTGSLDRDRWGPVADGFLAALATRTVGGRSLEIGENVRFQGGRLVRWVHETFPATGCALAVEVKKFFMDEHTGQLDGRRWKEVGEALAATVPAVVEGLGRSVVEELGQC